MSTTFTDRTEVGSRRLGSPQIAYGRIDGDAKQALVSLLDEINVGALRRPSGLPPEGTAYVRTLIRRDRRHETCAAHWVAGRSCALHGHSESQALFRVLSGTVVEERYVPEGRGKYRCEIQTLEGGQESYLPRGAFHRLHCLNDAATVHAFSPPPSDAVSPIPPERLPALEAAQRQLLALVSPVGGASRGSIVGAVEERVEHWARHEDEQNSGHELRVSPATLADLRMSGILAAPVPQELGGWGCSLFETAQAVRILAQRAPATALALAMPLGNAATTRIPDAAVPEKVRSELATGRRWIAEQVLAGRILAVANSEPGAGGDLAQTRTVAAAASNGVYKLTGKKSFATLGPDADYFLCAARREGEGPVGKDVVDGFFVARNAAGLCLDNAWNPLGMRATASVGLSLEASPAACVLGYRGCLEGVNARHWSTVLFAAVFVGVGEGALAAASKTAAAGSGGSSYIRASLAQCALNLEAAVGLLEVVADDERWPLPAIARDRTIRAKTFAAMTAVETATRAAMLAGGRAYRPDHPVSQFLHDALAGPLLRPPLAKVMDGIADQLFAPAI